MNEEAFERAWLAKFSSCLDEIAGEKIREEVMKGSETISSQQDIINWTEGAMNRLSVLVDEETLIKIMTGCACQYPRSQLQEIRNTYEETKDITLVHQMLQAQFESFLNTLKLSDEVIEDILQKGWGSAGVRDGNTILATKIPKSAHINQYYEAEDSDEKRFYYCHCPRIREAIKSGSISVMYCYCGAGFYKGIWEYILQQPVKVEVLESVLQGDDTCKFAIHLPLD